MTAQDTEADVQQKYARNHVDHGKAAIDRDLIEMRTVRLPDRLAPAQASQQVMVASAR
jgi:hypothetical protein